MATESRLSLLVMSRAGVWTFPLPDSGEVTIGRASDCQVRVDDAKVSRYHARLRVGVNPELVDLGSANGTFVGGRRLDANVPVAMGVGEMTTVGSAVLVLQKALAQGPERVWSQPAFAARVAAERERARAGGPRSAVLLLAFASGGIADPSRPTHVHTAKDQAVAEELDRTLQATLRSTDVIGSFAPGLYEVLLVDTEAGEARRMGAVLQSALREVGFDLAVEVQCHDGHERAPPPAAAVAATAPEAAQPPQDGTSALDEPTIDRIAASVINVLILGETGVGKEVMARRLHGRSPRADAPLLCLNCAALSESLLESELFGFEKGAFTGAVQSKPGLLESAQGGTVFLDEIGEMPISLQAKLLRVLEQREVQRIGALKPRAIDVRFLSATNRDLEAEIEAGRFRRDLYFRLNGIAVSIPPLRERVHEIEPLARAFVAEACAQSRRADVPDLTPAALALLKRYAWPGNIRELRNVMERAVVLCTGGSIGVEHLPADKMAPMARLGETPGGVSAGEVTGKGLEHGALEDIYGFDPERERARIVSALARCKGNQTEAAKLLGISRRTLVSRLAQYDLPRPRKRPDR